MSPTKLYLHATKNYYLHIFYLVLLFIPKFSRYHFILYGNFLDIIGILGSAIVITKYFNCISNECAHA